jgi:hypothetical protein
MLAGNDMVSRRGGPGDEDKPTATPGRPPRYEVGQRLTCDVQLPGFLAQWKCHYRRMKDSLGSSVH